MKLVCCTRIPGEPRHRIETCRERKEKAKTEAEKLGPINAKARKLGTGVVPMEHTLVFCLDCDPTEMKTVEFDVSGYAAPMATGKKQVVRKEKAVKEAKERAEKLAIEAKEEATGKEKKYVCKECGEGTDDKDKFIHEKGICRKCYMKDYYRKNPKKIGSKLAPRKSRQGEDVVERMLAQIPEGKILNTPVKDLTLRDVAKAGGEVRIMEKPTPSCKVCGIKCTEADTFSMEEKICGKCERKAAIPTVEEVREMKHTLRAPAKDRQGEILIMAVDFTGHLELYDFLKRVADEDFRSPENQVLALLKQIKGEG